MFHVEHLIFHLRYPVFHVECVTHRKNPIYATTIVGPPPMEDFYMGKSIERIFHKHSDLIHKTSS